MRIQGFSHVELMAREQAFEKLVQAATFQVLGLVEASLDDILVAAPSPEPLPQQTLSLGDLGVISAAWAAQVGNDLFPYLLETYTDGAAAVADALEEGFDVAVSVVPESYAQAYLRAAENRLRGIGDLIWSNVRAQLVAGNALGESMTQLAARVQDAAGVTAGRANAIARTEIIAAANAGSLGQVQLAFGDDPDVLKIWLATDDERTRIAHGQADGVGVPLGEAFVVGGEALQFPGDPNGSPGNIINCRCSLGYSFGEDDEPLTASLRKWVRDRLGRFAETPDSAGTVDGMSADVTPRRSEGFKVLPKAERGRSGDGNYAPGLYGKYGAAGLMVRAPGADGTERFLIVQRGRSYPNTRGTWQLPGGGLDELETPQQGAAREATEELGISQRTLDTFTERGTHRVEVPVEGKDPWAYSNITADAPAMFGGTIDGFELDDARWVSREQLLKLRERGKLLKPLADNLDQILAAFDEPLTASVTVFALGDGKWDEDEHPRSKKTGKFIKNGTVEPDGFDDLDGGGYQPAFVKMLQDKAKEKQQAPVSAYGAAAAVKLKAQAAKQLAEKAAASGPPDLNKIALEQAYQDLAHANMKMNHLGPTTPEFKVWEQEAKDLKKKINAFEKTLNLKEGVVKKAPVTALPPVPNLAKASSESTAALTLMKKNTAHWTASKIKLLFDDDLEDFLDTQIIGLTPHQYEAYLNEEAQDALRTAVKALDLKHGTTYTSQLDQLAIASATSALPAGTSVLPSGVGTVSKSVTEMDPWEFDTFFYTNVNKPIWDASSLEGKKNLKKAAEKASNAGVTSFPLEKITQWEQFDKLKAATNAPPIAAPSVPNGVPINLTHTVFYKTKYADGATVAERFTSTGAHQKLIWSSTGGKSGTGAFILREKPAGGSKWDYVGAFSKSTAHKSFQDGAVGSVFAGGWMAPGTATAPVKLTSSDALKLLEQDNSNWTAANIKALTSGDLIHFYLTQISALTTKEYSDILSKDARKALLDRLTGYDNMNGTSFATVLKQNYEDPLAAGLITSQDVKNNQLHKDVLAQMKSAAEIGTPNTDSASFSEVTAQDVPGLQQEMLQAADKAGFSSAERNAAHKYGTKTGYQTMNAILRNDTKMLAKHSAGDLEAALPAAIALQNAMTPLTRDIEVFRGTGAQAFGFAGNTVDFDSLKKLEGSTFVDRGFLSTTFVKNPTTSYDYATSKQIRVEIQAPAGTPAVFMGQANPGWDSESEMIIAAGTHFNIREVRKATAEDKAKHGSALEHVVTLRAVPQVGAPKLKAKPSDKPASPATSEIQELPQNPVYVDLTPGVLKPTAGKPIKVTTSLLYKIEYTDKAVIAESPGVPSDVIKINKRARRLVWDEGTKQVQLQELFDTEWFPATKTPNTFTKSAAFKEFHPENNWYKPGSITGTANVDASGGPSAGSSVNAPSVSGGKAVPDSKPIVFDDKTYDGNIKKFDSAQMFNLYQKAKYQGKPYATVDTPPAQLFAKLFNVSNELSANDVDAPEPKASILQLARVLDYHDAMIGAEKKLADWLATPDGQQTAQGLVKALAPVPLKPLSVSEVVPAPSTIGVPEVNVPGTAFKKMTNAKMQAWQDAQAPWTSEQISVLKSYTSSSTSYNGNFLRLSPAKQAAISENATIRKQVRTLQSAMRPLADHVQLRRGSSVPPFTGLDTMSATQLKKLVGSVVTDHGFVSSSIGSGFHSIYKLIIDAPKGTPAAYVEGITNIPGEQEVILAAGTKFRILSIESAYGETKIHLRVIP